MIKQATSADADKIATVITASIKACVQDHNNDDADIQAWLANKTADNIKEWINNHLAFVYTQDAQIVAVILAAHSGMILLNYTLPSKQGMGIGRQLLAHIMDSYKEQGIPTVMLESTLTAKSFYLKQGFTVVDNVREHGEVVAYKMVKAVA